MGKRGPKPGTVSKNKLSQEWTPELAYAIGLLASDGCLSPAGYLIDLTSKDAEQLQNYKRCLGLVSKIGKKTSGYGQGRYYHVQFKSVLFYAFLESIGLTPRKSKTLGALAINPKFFWHFLRGVYDGDGCSYSYWDPRWRSSFMYYTAFASASPPFLEWLEYEIHKRTGLRGRISTMGKKSRVLQLRYAKVGSLVLLRNMYPDKKVVSLSRKRLKVEKMLRTIGERL